MGLAAYLYPLVRWCWKGGRTIGYYLGTLAARPVDPFLQMLRSRVGPRDFGRAFADDIGYIIFNIRVTLPLVSDCLELFGLVSNVKLKITKTVLVPLWTTDLEAAKRIILGVVPSWQGVDVASKAKYLGVLLGPQTAETMWSGALKKYIARFQCARGSKAGFSIFGLGI